METQATQEVWISIERAAAMAEKTDERIRQVAAQFERTGEPPNFARRKPGTKRGWEINAVALEQWMTAPKSRGGRAKGAPREYGRMYRGAPYVTTGEGEGEPGDHPIGDATAPAPLTLDQQRELVIKVMGKIAAKLGATCFHVTGSAETTGYYTLWADDEDGDPDMPRQWDALPAGEYCFLEVDANGTIPADGGAPGGNLETLGELDQALEMQDVPKVGNIMGALWPDSFDLYRNYSETTRYSSPDRAYRPGLQDASPVDNINPGRQDLPADAALDLDGLRLAGFDTASIEGALVAPPGDNLAIVDLTPETLAQDWGQPDPDHCICPGCGHAKMPRKYRGGAADGTKSRRRCRNCVIADCSQGHPRCVTLPADDLGGEGEETNAGEGGA